MMGFYFVKRGLYGIPPGTVERFADHKAAPLVAAGDVEPFDAKRKTHAEAPGADSVPEGYKPLGKCASCGK